LNRVAAAAHMEDDIDQRQRWVEIRQQFRQKPGLPFSPGQRVQGTPWGYTGIRGRKGDEGFGLRAPVLDEDSRRLLVAVTNDSTGQEFLDSLRSNQEELGFRFDGTLGEILLRSGVREASLADSMRDQFAFLDILPGQDLAVANGILRHGCGLRPPAGAIADVDIEPDQPMRYRQQTPLGNNYSLRSSGSMHDRYLTRLQIPPTRSAAGCTIAVVDSGFEKSQVLNGFLDLVEPANKTEKDNFGHGTAMATIIADVAKNATIYSVRASDMGPTIGEAMLGVSGASFHYAPDIINLSFGQQLGQTCPTCGSGASLSKVFWRFLRSISEQPIAAGGPPILVAATGNDGIATGFDAPALWDFTVAVGSINDNKDRSSFSNYGTSGHSRYFMMPGGEESSGTVSEWVGEATHKCYGTSVAAAYASGVLALYMTNSSYPNSDRAKFLKAVLGNCQNCHLPKAAEHGLGYLDYR
jgi:hypothetical protein